MCFPWHNRTSSNLLLLFSCSGKRRLSWVQHTACAVASALTSTHSSNLQATLFQSHPYNLTCCYPLPKTRIYERESEKRAEVEEEISASSGSLFFPYNVCFGLMERSEDMSIWYLVEESVGLVHIHLENITDKDKWKVSWCQQTNAKMKPLWICCSGWCTVFPLASTW